MTYVSEFAAAIFLASWNVVSLAVEYVLLWVVYQRFPRLSYRQSESSFIKVGWSHVPRVRANLRRSFDRRTTAAAAPFGVCSARVSACTLDGALMRGIR